MLGGDWRNKQGWKRGWSEARHGLEVLVQQGQWGQNKWQGSWKGGWKERFLWERLVSLQDWKENSWQEWPEEDWTPAKQRRESLPCVEKPKDRIWGPPGEP